MLADNEILQIRPCMWAFEFVLSKTGDSKIVSLVVSEYELRQINSTRYSSKEKTAMFGQWIQTLQEFDG